MDSPVIEAFNIHAGYGNTTVLKNLSLTLKSGKIAGIRGPNGAGKTSFLKLCLGLLRPRSGELRVFGNVPHKKNFRKTLFRIGYVPQNTAGGVLPATVEEAVLMGRVGMTGLFRPLGKRDRTFAYNAMDALGLTALANRRVQELSGGQTQRVAIARALAMGAALLLLDEPTASLDGDGREDLVKIIRNLQNDRHISALVISHNEETLAGCDLIYHFENGAARAIAC
jgi:ABC-type Mn2+/Zn2+ transport system ATPase subunit